MTIPPAEHPLSDCSVWWHFIFGVGVACLFLLAGYSKTSEWRISKGKVPRFFVSIPTGGLEPTSPKALFKTDAQWDISEQKSYEKDSFSVINVYCFGYNILQDYRRQCHLPTPINLHQHSYRCWFRCIKWAYFIYLCTANPSHRFCRHIIKAFISACFRDSKSCKISSYLKQEGSKRPLGYDYPAAERPIVDCSVWWHFIFGVGVRCLFL